MSFADAAARLAGVAGIVFGWTPETFWNATPTELGTLVTALRGDAGEAPVDAATLERLKEAFPDG